jgi:chromate transporter
LLAASIPCAILVAALAALLAYWRHNNVVQAALHGAIAAAVGITTKTCWTIAHPYFKGRDGQIRVVLIGAAAFTLYVFALRPAATPAASTGRTRDRNPTNAAETSESSCQGAVHT